MSKANIKLTESSLANVLAFDSELSLTELDDVTNTLVVMYDSPSAIAVSSNQPDH